MVSLAAINHGPAAIRACTVSRDIQFFDLLIEDMESELGEAWGDLSFEKAAIFLDQPEAKSLDFIAIAMDEDDEQNMVHIRALIQRAKSMNIKIILIAEELGPTALHQLLRLGADDFVPYPLPEGALHESIERLRSAAKVVPIKDETRLAPKAPTKNGVVIAVQALAGGAGSSTFAMNLAWELANAGGDNPPKVCILDFDLQTGSIATYLDLARTERVYELLSNTAAMDAETFLQTVQIYDGKLSVLTAPADMLPLDLLGPDEINRVVQLARDLFDYVVIDMPGTVVQWTESVLNASQLYFALMELDMRSAQNALRLIRALKAESLPLDKLRFTLNRAPKFTDLAGKSRAKRMADSLGISLAAQLPDGTAQVAEANDHGMPLAKFAAKNPLLKEIRKLAHQLHDVEKKAVKAG
jgi:pilus assembly protein CpaE